MAIKFAPKSPAEPVAAESKTQARPTEKPVPDPAGESPASEKPGRAKAKKTAKPAAKKDDELF